MTDKEIIKSLECCKKDDCDNCPNDFGNCYANLSGYSLDLINRKQAEIDELKHEREVLIKDIHHYINKTIEQLEEIERLKADNKTLENVIKNTFFKKAGLDIDPLAEVKSEAIKDFADRLLDKARVVQVGNLTWVWLISQDDINDIIKEMLAKSDKKIYYL